MTPNFSLDKITISNSDEAEEVIEVLRKLVNFHKRVTVNQFYELINLRGNYLGDKWGWTDLRIASVRETQDGYRFSLPQIEPFDLQLNSKTEHQNLIVQPDKQKT